MSVLFDVKQTVETSLYSIKNFFIFDDKYVRLKKIEKNIGPQTCIKYEWMPFY